MPQKKPLTNLDETIETAERTRAAKIQTWFDNLIADIQELLEVPDKVFLVLEQMQLTTTGFWAAVAIAFPPVFLTVVFAKSLWDLGAALFLDKDAKLKRGARAGLAITAITLFAVIIALPALTLPLLATFVGALIIKESVDLFYEYKEFIENKAKLATLQEEQHQLRVKDPDKLTDAEQERLTQLPKEIQALSQTIKQQKNGLYSKSLLLGFAATTMVGLVLLAFPPTLIAGVALFAGSLVGMVSLQAGNWIKNKLRARKQNIQAAKQAKEELGDVELAVLLENKKAQTHQAQPDSTTEFAVLMSEKSGKSGTAAIMDAQARLEPKSATAQTSETQATTALSSKETLTPKLKEATEEKKSEDESEGEGEQTGSHLQQHK